MTKIALGALSYLLTSSLVTKQGKQGGGEGKVSDDILWLEVQATTI